MADITMCMYGCELQKNCYRWTATVNEYRQSYSDFKRDEAGVCYHQWPLTLQKADIERLVKKPKKS